MKPFRKYLAEALSEDEYMARAEFNQKIHKDMSDSLHSLQNVIEEIRNIVWYGYNKKIKDEVKDIAKYCKEIQDLSKQLKELS